MRANRPANELLAWIPRLEAGEASTASDVQRSTGGWLPVVGALHRAVLDSERFLTPSEFPWGAWRTEARRITRDRAAIAAADLLTLRKVLVCIWHQDRVGAGTFSNACSSGVMLAILSRVRELLASDAVASGDNHPCAVD